MSHDFPFSTFTFFLFGLKNNSFVLVTYALEEMCVDVIKDLEVSVSGTRWTTLKSLKIQLQIQTGNYH